METWCDFVIAEPGWCQPGWVSEGMGWGCTRVVTQPQKPHTTTTMPLKTAKPANNPVPTAATKPTTTTQYPDCETECRKVGGQAVSIANNKNEQFRLET